MNDLRRVIAFLVLLAIAAGLGMAAGLAVAALGHEILAATFGEDGIAAVDDTPLMFTFVAASYATWVVVGLAVFIFGWRRFVRPRG